MRTVVRNFSLALITSVICALSAHAHQIAFDLAGKAGAGLLSGNENGTINGTLPAVMNAANEVAVSAFLEKRLSFSGIWELVEKVMTRHACVADASLDAILAADQWARNEAAGLIRNN